MMFGRRNFFLKTITLTLFTLSLSYGVEGWQKASIANCCTFEYPSEMEVQWGKYKVLNDEFRRKIFSFSENEPKIIIQQKGLNGFNQTSFKSYARIMVETDDGNPGDYANIHTLIKLTPNELNNLDAMYKNEMKRGFDMVNAKAPEMNMRAVSWNPVKVVNINGVSMIKVQYKRIVMNNPPAIVTMYMVQDYDKMHIITVSYRESDSVKWKTNLNKVIYTFKFL